MPSPTKKIQAVERSFAILEALSLADAPLSLQAISQQVALHKTTVHGLLATLHALGYVGKTGHDYHLGLRLRELSKPLEQHDEAIRRHFYPLLRNMAQLTGHTAYLALPSGTQEYLYIDAIEQDTPLTIRSPRGVREGLTTSAIGKIFLAFNPALRRTLRLTQPLSPELEQALQQVATQGYALDLEEAEPGLNCLAIPLYRNGEFVAAAGVSGASSEFTQARMIQFAGEFLSPRAEQADSKN